ncbi:MAG: PD-(D/E)XK nuclease family protein, partial [Spirochaetota bacterium]
MRALREAYTESIAEAVAAGTTVVLPSELAAEFWRHELVRSGMRAVREDRVISWDRFKEQAFDLRTDRLPSNRTARALFVERLLSENAREPFLERLVPPSSAASAEGFRAQLTRILPSLPQGRALPDLMREGLDPGRREGLLGLVSDLRAVESKYEAFLEAHNLFEPAWLERVPAYRGGDHLLVMPELAEDYPEFAPALSAVARVDVPEATLPSLRHYADSRTELESTLGEIAALLDAGAAPESIVLTVGDLDRLRTRLEQAAELAELPLSFRQGVPLSQSAAGRFLGAMADVVSSGFSLGSLKKFLLNRAVPWRDFDVNSRLILAGAGAGCLGGRSRPDPRWRRLAVSPERELIDLLVDELPALTRARTAADLRTRLFRLLSRLIDRDRWDLEDERLLQRALEELRVLSEFELTHDLVVDAPYRFWMDRLVHPDDREGAAAEVARGDARGVQVFPYRVGAGLYPDHHFVLNAGNTTTRVRSARFPFLTDAEREELGDAVADRDMSELFARAYAVSGRDVVVSCGRTTWDGPVLPPAEFVAARSIQEAGRGVSPYEGWASEEAFGDAPTRVYRLQRDGTAAYLRGAAPGTDRAAADLTRQPMADEGLVELALSAQRHKRRPDLVSLSAADINNFRTCPFSYLLSRVLKLRELDFDVDPDSARDIGSLYHVALEAFFRELGASQAVFDPEQIDAYQSRLGEIVRELSARGPGMIPSFVYAALEPLADRVFARLLEHDAGFIPGHRVESIEEWEQTIEVEAGAFLVGRVDRVTRSPFGELTLVDYKKRGVPSGKSQNGGEKEATGIAEVPEEARVVERDRIESVQIPFYVRLLEDSGARVASAAYYSLEEGKPQTVVSDEPVGGKPVMTRERMDEILVLLDDIIRYTLRRLFAGDYSCERGCPGCTFRG